MFNRLVRLFAHPIKAIVIKKDKLILNMKCEGSMKRRQNARHNGLKPVNAY